MTASPALSAPEVRTTPPARRTLRRQLGTLGTISLSVGVMAPTLAMSSTGVQPAGLIGRAAPLAFVFAAVGVALVSSGFVMLSRTIGHAGSVYAFVGRALGPRAGFVAGWALLGTYLVFPAVSMAAFATFTRAFLDETGLWTGAPWLPLALVGWALMGGLASRQIRTAARSLLAFEIVSMLLILALVVVIVVTLAAGDAPQGQDLNTDWLHIPSGIGFS